MNHLANFQVLNNTISDVKLDGLSLARHLRYYFGDQAIAEASRMYDEAFAADKNSIDASVKLNALTRLKLNRL